MLSPVAFVASVIYVHRLSHGSWHTWWLLLLAPVCLWWPLQVLAMLLSWALQGGFVELRGDGAARSAREIWLARPPCPRHERPPDRAELITDVARPAIGSTVVAGCGGVRGRSTLPDAAIETHLKPCRIGEALHELEEVGARAREDEEVRGLERRHGTRAYRESRFKARWSDLNRAG